MATIGQFSSGMAHQLNTPLATILTYAQMILIDIKNATLNPEALLKRIITIEQQCQRSKEIIQHLLTFSRPHKVKFIPVNLNQVIEDSLRIVEGELAKFEIKVVKELEPCSEIMGDFHQLQELVVHLIMNAQQAMSSSKSRTLTIETMSIPKFIKIRIDDTGEGIPEKDINHIFEPFFTNRPGGTGLGLFICRNIVYNHNGFIDVHSKVGEGTTFTISLPLTKNKR
jgi:two-component system NtrC family sensor kinase